MDIHPLLPESPSFTGVKLSATGALIFGDGVTEGDWKIVRDGNNLKVYRLESTVWEVKGTFKA